MKRRLRGDEAIDDVDLEYLYDALKHDDRLEVHLDGEGSCFYKAYLAGRTGPKEGFFRGTRPFHKSYVDWSRQDKACRDAFALLVKSPDTPKGDGSELRRDASVADVLQAVRQFLDAVCGSVQGASVLLPEEIAAADGLVIEGEVFRVMVNAYERDPRAREQCIAAHGTSCCICGFDFGKQYGEVARGFIHVHHLHPLSEVRERHTVNPVTDLRPVCPNCHAVLHRRIPAYGIEDVQVFLREQKGT